MSILSEKWFWIIVISVLLVVSIPLVVVWVILQLPFPYNLIATILIVITWGVASGYKDWVMTKRKEEEKS